MPNEFIARNGIVSRGNLVVSGSVTSTSPASFSGSLTVTGSLQVSSSANSFFIGGGNVGINTSGSTSRLTIAGGNLSNGVDNTSILLIDTTQTATYSPSIGFPFGLNIIGTYTDTNTANNTIFRPFINVDTLISSSTNGLSSPSRIFTNISPSVNVAGRDINNITRIFNISSTFTARNVNNITGIYYNPTFTLTGANNNHIAIETVTGDVLFNTTSGNTLIGSSVSNTAKLSVKGSGATSSTTSFLVQNANASSSLQVKDDLTSTFGGSMTVISNDYAGIDLRRTVPNSQSWLQLYATGDFNPVLFKTQGVDWLGYVRSTSNIFLNRGNQVALNDNSGVSPTGSIISSDIHIYNATNSPKLVFWSPFSVQTPRGQISTSDGTSRGGNLIFSVNNNNLGLSALTEYMRITQVGNVGIGTSTPSASLHISGSSGSALLEIDSPAVNNILYVSGSGNVGIGTGTPTYTLQVIGTSSIAANFGVGGSNDGTILIGNTVGDGLQLGRQYNNGQTYFNAVGNSTGGYSFRFAGAEKVAIDSSGNTTLSGTLRLAGNGSVQGLTNNSIYVPSGNGGASLIFRENTNGKKIAISSDSSGNTIFYNEQANSNFANSDISMYIVGSSKNVLIGTTTDSARLTVKGSGTTSSTTSFLVQNANASGSLQVYDNGQVYFPNGDISYGSPSGAPIKLNITQPTGTSVYAGVNIGHLNSAVASSVTVVGGRNTFNNNAHFIFGHQNNISSASAAFVFGSSHTQTTYSGYHIMIGYGHTSDAYTNGQNASILIGQSNSTNGFYGGGLIGSNLKYYANRQLAFGGNSDNVNFALSEIYFGNGVRNENTSVNSNNGHGPNISINTSQAYSGSAALNRNGGSLSLRGGQGTGTGSAGDVIFATATTGSDGATYHSYSNRVWVKGHTGFVGIGTSTPSASLHISGSSNSVLFEIDSPAVNNILYVSGSGRVGIGTSNPSASLHVSGTVLIDNILTLTPQDPLPTGVATGSFAVSSSVPPKPYFYDGTSWNALY